MRLISCTHTHTHLIVRTYFIFDFKIVQCYEMNRERIISWIKAILATDHSGWWNCNKVCQRRGGKNV